MNPASQAKYLEAVCDPREQKMISKIWQQTIVVSEKEFEQALDMLAERLVAVLGNDAWVAVAGDVEDTDNWKNPTHGYLTRS